MNKTDSSWKFAISLMAMVVVVGLCFMVLTACNKQILDLNLKFDRAYVKIGDEWKDVAIKLWNDYDGEQIQITLQDDTVILTSSMNCILYKGELPK